jgi:hypothetical protein
MSENKLVFRSNAAVQHVGRIALSGPASAEMLPDTSFHTASLMTISPPGA